MYFFSTATNSLPMRLLLLALFIVCITRSNLRRPAIVGVLAFLPSNAICDVLKRTFKVIRPSVEMVDAIVRVDGGRGYGTASAHAANMMAVAVAFWRCGPVARVIGISVAVLTGISRVYNGVHYPSQVLLGWTIGAAVAILIDVIWGMVATRGQAKPSAQSSEGSSDPSSPESPAASHLLQTEPRQLP